MAEVEKDWIIPMGYKIKQGGVIHLEYLYKDMFRWFEHFGYNWKEVQYLQDTKPDGGIQLEIRWKCEKEINDYLSFVIITEFMIVFKDVEVEIDGKKVKRQKGSVELRMGAYIGKNTELWKNMGTLRKMYDNFLIRGRIEDHEDDLYIEVHKLFDFVKKFLKLNRG